MSAGARDHYLAEHARVAGSLPGARIPWLRQIRGAALDAFAQRGLPTRHDEEWKYTSVAEFERQRFVVVPDGGGAASAAALTRDFALEHEGAHLLVFHNGRHAPALSSPGTLPAGVVLDSIAHTLATAPERLQPYLANEDDPAAFNALNTAFMADGAYLHLPRGTALEAPVHLLFIATEMGAANHVRNLIVAEAGARATVVEHYLGAERVVYFCNAVTSLSAAADAAIEHHKLQQEAPGAIHVAGIHAMQERDSSIESHSFTLGAALTRNDISTVFNASGCTATLNGLYLVNGNQHVDNHTRIDHRQPHGTSRENYRGVLDGLSHGVFNGKVVVHPGAQKTNAYQVNHNLLLSEGAEIDTKPQLEIYTDDVKCNHGATVGRLDQTQMFYLRSRGIDEIAARNLLIQAFAHDVVDRVRVVSLRTRLEQILRTRLSHGPDLGVLS